MTSVDTRDGSPIFIHSLFRTSSTYIFNKFRSLGDDYTCYKEPLHENLLCLNDPKRWGELIEPPNSTIRHLRHPVLEKPYFYEFWLAREQLCGLFKESFSYSHYFTPEGRHLSPELVSYLSALLDSATGRPILHFCRSSGRIKAMKQALGGVHLYLWRDPRVQWWSYKVSEYFDQANRKICRSASLPKPLKEIVGRIDRTHKRNKYLPAHENYKLFYALWLDAWIRGNAHADMSFNIDAASLVPSENMRLSAELSAQIGRPISFSDMRVPVMCFQAEENDFYEAIEDEVNQVFVQLDASSVHEILQATQDLRPVREKPCYESRAEKNLRQLSLGLLDRIAKLERPLFQFL